MAISTEQTDWREIIHRGVENQQLDYKAAQNWNQLNRAGKAKFARHAMAMANTRGGYVVVGVAEDENGNPTVCTGLTEQQAKSFDPSTVGQTINRYADPSIEFDIVRPEVDGKRYVIFVIYPFRNLPHVSGDACEHELQRGVFYIRTPDARSRAAYRASELHGLVQRSLRNQRKLLGRMIRGVLYEGRQFTESGPEQEFGRLVSRCRQEARRTLGAKRFSQSVVFEVSVSLNEFLIDRFTLSDIGRVQDGLTPPGGSDLPVLPLTDVTTYATNESVRSYLETASESTPPFYWEFFLCGLLYCAVVEAGEDSPAKVVSYTALLRRVGSMLHAIGHVYAELGLEAELLTMTFRLVNTEGAYLALPGRMDHRRYRCFIPDVEVVTERSVADVAAAPAPNAAKIISEICERFDFRSDEHVGLNQKLEALLRHTPG